MKFLFLSSLIAAVSLGESPAPSTGSSAELAGEQIALTALLDACANRACNADGTRYWYSESIVTDLSGGQTFAMAVNAWSPDGKTILNGGNDILLMPATGGMQLNLTNHPAAYLTPAWSPDGTRIAFASDRDGPVALYVMRADGSDLVRLDTGVGLAMHPTWSPDSSRLAFTCVIDTVSSPWYAAAGDREICAINADGSGFAQLTQSVGNDANPDWSPDGERIIFDTERYGGVELAFMTTEGAWVSQVSPGLQGHSPRWSTDGSRIAFVNLVPYYFDPYFPDAMDPYVSIIGVDGTPGAVLGMGYDPVWRPFDAGSPKLPAGRIVHVHLRRSDVHR